MKIIPYSKTHFTKVKFLYKYELEGIKFNAISFKGLSRFKFKNTIDKQKNSESFSVTLTRDIQIDIWNQIPNYIKCENYVFVKVIPELLNHETLFKAYQNEILKYENKYVLLNFYLKGENLINNIIDFETDHNRIQLPDLESQLQISIKHESRRMQVLYDIEEKTNSNIINIDLSQPEIEIKNQVLEIMKMGH